MSRELSRELEDSLEFVRRCRELGATAVSVGEVRVLFDRPRPAAPAAEDEEELTPEERRRFEESRAKREEELTYWSAD